MRDRIETILEVVDEILLELKQADLLRNGFVYLYGVERIIRRAISPRLTTRTCVYILT